MKKYLSLFFFLQLIVLTSCTTDADDESDNFDAAKVCPVSGRGTFTDERDGQVYKYTTIGNQVWMAENLKYDAEYSVCLESYKFSNDIVDDFCNKFGRFYSVQEKGSYLNNIDDSVLITLCPEKWHIPSVEEWMEMLNLFDSDIIASKKLRSSYYWAYFYEPGEDVCGFSVYPAGAYMSEKYGLEYYARNAIFLTSSKRNSSQVETFNFSNGVTVFNNLPKMSIRCVKD